MKVAIYCRVKSEKIKEKKSTQFKKLENTIANSNAVIIENTNNNIDYEKMLSEFENNYIKIIRTQK